MHSPFFIIGTQRSGTTLLTRMLSAHPELFIQNEMGDWGVFNKPYSPEQLHERIVDKLGSHGVNVKELQVKRMLWGWKDPMLTPHIFELLHNNQPPHRHCLQSQEYVL